MVLGIVVPPDTRVLECIPNLILPTHRLLDAAYEAAKGDSKIGTTGKGIGPTYTDKISRNGVRVGDLLHNFDKKYAAAIARHKAILAQYNYPLDQLEAIEKEWFAGIEVLKKFQFIDSEHVTAFANGNSLIDISLFQHWGYLVHKVLGF